MRAISSIAAVAERETLDLLDAGDIGIHEDNHDDEDELARLVLLDDVVDAEDSDPAEQEEQEEDGRVAAASTVVIELVEAQDDLDLARQQREQQQADERAQWVAVQADCAAPTYVDVDRPVRMSARQRARRDLHNPHAWAEEREAHEERVVKELEQERAWQAKSPAQQKAVYKRRVAQGWERQGRRELKVAANGQFSTRLRPWLLAVVARQREYAERKTLLQDVRSAYRTPALANAQRRTREFPNEIAPLTAAECAALRRELWFHPQTGHPIKPRLPALGGRPIPGGGLRTGPACEGLGKTPQPGKPCAGPNPRPYLPVWMCGPYITWAEAAPAPDEVRPHEVAGWMSTHQIAVRWGVSAETVRKRLARAGALPSWATDGNAYYYPPTVVRQWEDEGLWRGILRCKRVRAHARREQHPGGYGWRGRKYRPAGEAMASVCHRLLAYPHSSWLAGRPTPNCDVTVMSPEANSDVPRATA
jgi:hypothetical protein